MAAGAQDHDREGLRARARAARRDVGPAALVAAGAAVADRVWPLLQEAPVVLTYAALPEELPLDPLIQRLLADGRTVGLPRVTGPGVLALHVVTDLDDLVPGAFGVREPTQDSQTLAPDAVAAVLVPGVAFDRDGGRLGYGGGYYDRLLPRLGGAVRIGVCLEAQLVPAVAVEAHDQRVDAVVTEAGVYR